MSSVLRRAFLPPAFIKPPPSATTIFRRPPPSATPPTTHAAHPSPRTIAKLLDQRLVPSCCVALAPPCSEISFRGFLLFAGRETASPAANFSDCDRLFFIILYNKLVLAHHSLLKMFRMYVILLMCKILFGFMNYIVIDIFIRNYSSFDRRLFIAAIKFLYIKLLIISYI